MPFRLASFFDPQGTANQRDPREAARLRRGGGPGGRSGPSARAGCSSSGRPAPSSRRAPGQDPREPASPGGDAAENCTFAIELITIVAMFVFTLFLPIVVFVFQLWWLLC